MSMSYKPIPSLTVHHAKIHNQIKQEFPHQVVKCQSFTWSKSFQSKESIHNQLKQPFPHVKGCRDVSKHIWAHLGHPSSCNKKGLTVQNIHILLSLSVRYDSSDILQNLWYNTDKSILDIHLISHYDENLYWIDDMMQNPYETNKNLFEIGCHEAWKCLTEIIYPADMTRYLFIWNNSPEKK